MSSTSRPEFGCGSMSLTEPKFGDVFRWKSDTQDTLVMYVAPTDYDMPTPTLPDGTYVKDTWVGVSLDEGDFLPMGDVDIRLTLAYAAWTEVIE